MIDFSQLLSPEASQPPPTPPKTPEEQAQLEGEWQKFFARPEISAGLLQMGGQLLQPMQPGQTMAGNVSAALVNGASTVGNAASNIRKEEQAQEEVDYSRAKDQREESRADKRLKIASQKSPSESLAEKRFAYDQQKDAVDLARQLDNDAYQRQLEQAQIRAKVLEGILGTTDQADVESTLDTVLKQLGLPNVGSAETPATLPEVAPNGTEGAAAPTGGKQATGQEVAPAEMPEAAGERNYNTQSIENHIAAMKTAKVKEQIDQMGPGAAAIINEEVLKYPKEVRQRVLDYFVKGL